MRPSRLPTLDLPDHGGGRSAGTCSPTMRGARIRRDRDADPLGRETKAQVDVLSIEEVPLVEALDLEERRTRHKKARAGQGGYAVLSERRDFAESEEAADPELAGQQDPGREVRTPLTRRLLAFEIT